MPARQVWGWCATCLCSKQPASMLLSWRLKPHKLPQQSRSLHFLPQARGKGVCCDAPGSHRAAPSPTPSRSHAMSLRLLRHSWTKRPLSRSTIMFLGLVRFTVPSGERRLWFLRGQQHCGGHAGLGHLAQIRKRGVTRGSYGPGVCLELDAVPVALGDQHQCGPGPLSWLLRPRLCACDCEVLSRLGACA